MGEPAWKAAERRIAEMFFSERTPLSGSNSKHTKSDTLSDQFYVEAKYREFHSARTLLEDTRKKAKEERKLPVVALVDKKRPGFTVCVHSSDLRKFVQVYMLIHARELDVTLDQLAKMRDT